MAEVYKKTKTGVVCRGFRWVDARERDYLEDRCRWKDNSKVAIEKVVLGHGLDWTGLT